MDQKVKGKKKELLINCAQCATAVCRTPEGREKAPKNCPVRTKPHIIESAKNKVLTEFREFAYIASKQEGSCYMNLPVVPGVRSGVKTRLEEIIEFAKRMGYRRLGVAYCGGVSGEARTLVEILKDNDFEVASVRCKCGSIPKEELGIKDWEKNEPGRYEVMCNPILQALLLNDANTDLNIMLCLCVGHDSLFLKHVKGFTTVLATKDRALAHNPLAALYLSESYMRRVRVKERFPDAFKEAAAQKTGM
ncbi:DUF1847 domain-containing protein [Chloroflexota bacterium]